jgi:hypothetical protein
MNIQKLISLIRQARKRRQVFLFHDKPRSGIDVLNNDWPQVVELICSLFKYFKSQNCQIEVSWWGEIFVTLSDYDMPFEISINQRPLIKNVSDIIREVNESGISTVSVEDYFEIYSITVRPIRKNSKIHSFPINITSKLVTDLGDLILEHITRKVSSYYSQCDEFIKLRAISIGDIIAIVRLGSAQLGRQALFYSIARELSKRIFVKGIEIKSGRLTLVGGSYEHDCVYQLGKKEMKFLSYYLPESELSKNDEML